MSTAQSFQAQTSTHYRVPLQVYRGTPQRREITLVILPALGIAAKFYARIAQALAEQGLDVVVMEQRGHGESAWRPSRQCDYGFREWLRDDIPATLDWAWHHLPGERRFLLGHSLGGHLGAMACGLYPERVNGLILSACASPWPPAYSTPMRMKLAVLAAAVKLSGPTLGYYPGSALGFGGREARTLMRDWYHMLRANRYAAQGVAHDLDNAVNQYAGQVLSLRYADDDLAPEAATRAVTDKLGDAELTYQLIRSDHYTRPADHYQWAREPQPTVEAIKQWLARA